MYEISLLIFFLSLALLVYVYAGFSGLVMIWGTLRNRKVAGAPATPRVSLIIAAYNEEEGIESKIHNVLALDYPRDCLEILVGSDGSDDRTEEIVSRYQSQGIQLLSFPRRGKIHVLKDLVSMASGEILVFSDANTLFSSQALKQLVWNFADPEVGGVCGNQKYLRTGDGDSSDEGENLYWTYDKWLKSMESRTGSIVSADGAIYAIRRHLFRPPESAAVTDDFAISTKVIELGYRLIFDPEALAYEKSSGAAKREFRRKVRLMNRGMRSVLLRRALLNPFRYGFYSLVLFSHKVLRRLTPVFLMSLFATSLILASNHTFFALVAMLQGLFYFLAGAGCILRAHHWGQKKYLSTPFFYCLANVAALFALVKLARGEHIERWQPQRQGIGN